LSVSLIFYAHQLVLNSSPADWEPFEEISSGKWKVHSNGKKWLNARFDRWFICAPKEDHNNIEDHKFLKILEFLYISLWTTVDWKKYEGLSEGGAKTSQNVRITMYSLVWE
jgi:hypothetical protein